MSVSHWLFRLNLEQFTPGFIKENIKRVIDLKEISDGDLEKFGVKKEGDKKRIMNMLKGDDASKKGFNYMKHQSMRSFLSLFLKDQKEIESLVSSIPEDSITEFHLRDVFEKNLNQKYKEKADDMLSKGRTFMGKKKVRKTVDAPKKYPKETPIQILERLKMEKYIPNFIENDVLDPECFYKLEMGNLKGELKIDSLRKVLIKENENFNKKGVEGEDIELGGPLEELIVEQIQNALKKSTSIKY